VVELRQASPEAVSRVDPATKKVAILIFDEVQVIDYSGPLEVFSDAGFEVFTVAETREPVTTSAGDAVKLSPKYTFADAPHADLIVIPGGGFEAGKESATVAWIKRESEHAEHVMSVCNGAFTLANTGMLDGKRATTTAGNINRFRQTFPAIETVTDQRVVDNGKLVTTAGLSAGIDGALHMVDVMKGTGDGRSVALEMELDRPDKSHARGVMADRLLPSIYRVLHAQHVVDSFDHTMVGDEDAWERTTWYATNQSAAELFAIVIGAYRDAYAHDGFPWVPSTFRTQIHGPTDATLWFDDRQGGHWTSVVSVTSPKAGAPQLVLRVAIRRVGSPR